MVDTADRKALLGCGRCSHVGTRCFGVGCVIWDDKGTLIVATTLPLVESINVLHAELVVLRFGLQLSISYDLSPTIVYSNA